MKKSNIIKLLLFVLVFVVVILVINNEALKYAKQIDLNLFHNNFEAREKLGQKFYESDRIYQLAKVILSLIIPVLFLITGFSAKLRNFSKGISKRFFIVVGVYGVIYTLIENILTFPFIYYGGYVQRKIFGLSHQSFLMWLKNYSIELLINFIMIFLILWIPYKIISKSPKRWWIYTGILSIPLSAFLFFAHPIIIDPLFNDFKAIENKSVETQLVELTKKAGIENCNILVIDKSKETSMINAYMTGIGDTRRIVLWDTALKSLNVSELKFITAHEMGHYVLGHIKKFMIFEIIATFILLYIVSVAAPYLINKYKNKFRVKDLKDIASLPLIFLILNLCFIITTPVFNVYSCYIEKQADIYALEITKDNKAGSSSFKKLSENGIVIPYPDPVYKLWKFDHPPIKERIEFFEKYVP
ncbi:protease HtpX [Clostridium homopropionicum DSM 5847]|uniref:Protease HtpX n=1 Tax=Clostridium homopropionicum DSM 5847 TaxID=1121318 RepID=A0A0L6ZEL7_9CLOT|nr:M48 family metallopeptidase [Clostridium homopropionicum]KOA21397.1 protease HtpX [Clostridium homopropionicum DSM 5847]SFG11222.1 CAAX prenyl protease N-terminal, five membrane helices [Clostridium homopropionicum]